MSALPMNLPPEYGPVFQDTSRQMKLADLLRQQALEAPQGQMVSGHYVAANPLQHVAQLLKAYNANKMETGARDREEGIYKEWEGRKLGANQKLAEALKPTQQPVDYSDAGGMPGMTQTVQPDFDTALAEYVASGVADPAMIALAQSRQNRLEKDTDRQEDRDFRQQMLTEQQTARKEEKQLQREQRMQELQLRLMDAQTSRAEQAAARKELAQMQIDARRDMVALTNANRAATAKEKEKKVDWKYDSGSDTWVAPPDAENPNGRRLANQEKQNAQRSMEIVLKQFEGEQDANGKVKGGVIDSTPQGGWMGIKGKAGAVSNYQQKKRFDNLREQLSTELRTVFRIPGEGALSDKEQAQYGMQLPSTDYDPEINRQILADIRARVQARLGGEPQKPIMQRNEQMPTKKKLSVTDEADRILGGK